MPRAYRTAIVVICIPSVTVQHTAVSAMRNITTTILAAVRITCRSSSSSGHNSSSVVVVVGLGLPRSTTTTAGLTAAIST